MKFTLIILSASLLASDTTLAAATRVNWFNSPGTELLDNSGTPLFQGTNPAGYDGDIIQLGYYTMATTSSPYSGIWIPLETWTIGQKLGGINRAGLFNYDSIISESSELTGIPLSLRFFDSPAIETATFFNNAANLSGSWNLNFSAAGSLVINISLTDQGLAWQDGSGSAFRTTIPVPEPCVTGLMLASFLLFQHRIFRMNQ